MKTKHLIVDTAAFVKYVPLWEYGEEFYSIPEVIAEIRDKAARERFEALPVTVAMRQPQPWAIKFVNQFSKKTGDYAILSLADIKILALTYELEIEARGSSSHLRTEPQKCVVEGPKSQSKSIDSTNIEGFHDPDGKNDSSEVPELEGQAGETPCLLDLNKLTVIDDDEETESLNEEIKVVEEGSSEQEEDATHFSGKEFGEGENIEHEECGEADNKNGFYFPDDENEDCYNGDEEDDDDDEDWITPSNIKKHKLKNRDGGPAQEQKEEDSLVACLTSDFAMQNVLKHIGLSVMGVDGKIISRIRTYVLRCYACFKICNDMTKIFCPRCGHKTLKRVSVTVNPDGTQKIWINFKKPINTKGTIFSIPRPKGGQHARNPILVADQREVRQSSSQMSRKTVNPLNEDYDPVNQPFAIRDVYSRAAQLGYMGGKCHNHFYWENPNARGKKGKRKGK